MSFWGVQAALAGVLDGGRGEWFGRIRLMGVVRTCVGRLTGRCRGCVPDLDEGHHPNNRDCPGYVSVGMWVFEVVEGSNGGMADAHGSGPCGEIRGGSSPLSSTKDE